jgi:hypothetical protein
MFKIGPYTLDTRNPIQYMVLWGISFLCLMAIAGVVPPFAILGAAMICLGTLFATTKG